MTDNIVVAKEPHPNRNAQSGLKGHAVLEETVAEVADFRSQLDEIAREGAQRMLQTMLESEVDEFVIRYQGVVDGDGHRQVVRNGRLPCRKVTTGAGQLEVQHPRVRDRRGKEAEDSVVFNSKILPPYLRRSKNIEELLPWLYLKGVSTGGFQEALQPILGSDAPGLSASTVTRLVSVWADEHDTWSKLYPKGPFASLEAARIWVEEFVDWYNNKHLHSGISFVTPSERHRGLDDGILEARKTIFEAARRRNPNRWTGRTRAWNRVDVVRLNPRPDVA